MSKAQRLLEVLDTLLIANEEYVEVFRNQEGQLVDEEGNTYDDEDLVPFDERGKGGKKMPPWLMKGKDKKEMMKMKMKKGK